MLAATKGLSESLGVPIVVIEKPGRSRAVLLSLRDYVRLALPEPQVLPAIGIESQRKGTSTLSAAHINRVIKAACRSKRR